MGKGYILVQVIFSIVFQMAPRGLAFLAALWVAQSHSPFKLARTPAPALVTDVPVSAVRGSDSNFVGFFPSFGFCLHSVFSSFQFASPGVKYFVLTMEGKLASPYVNP